MDIFGRIKSLGFFIILGVLIIIIAGMIVVYVQQDKKQDNLSQQVQQLDMTLKNPAPDNTKLVEEYKQVRAYFTPPSLEEIVETMLLIAEGNGIDVSLENKNFVIPQQNLVREKLIGKSKYQALILNNIAVQGKYESVMGFISDLESGDQIKTLVIRSIDLRKVNPSEISPDYNEYRAIIGVDIYFNTGS